MKLAQDAIKSGIARKLEEINDTTSDEALKKAITEYLGTLNDTNLSAKATDELIPLLEKCDDPLAKEVLKEKNFLSKKSHWIFGGERLGIRYRYGGVDHVLAANQDVNMFVFDTEVYSNTGGQSSKATPLAAMAKFAAAGKRSRKKDLGMMAMSYGNVYVAQVAIGADYNQFVKAIVEAEAYDGPSLIICYAPCINHGLKCGMGKTIQNEADAVKSGYWHLYRHNPELKAEGKNPFTLDSKEPTESFRDFIMGQVRYASIAKQFPEQAEELFTMAEQSSKDRLESYKRLANQ